MNQFYKITKLDNEYNLKIIIENENIKLENICHFDFLKIMFELYKNILVDYKLDINTPNHCLVYILFKHLFEDFGYSQKCVYLNIQCEKNENVIYTVTPIPFQSNIDIIPFTELTGILSMDNDKLQIEISASLELDLPEYIENIIISFIEKMVFTFKQFIDKIK